MNAVIRRFLPLAALALVFSGCGEGRAAKAVADPPAQPAANYKAGYGLQVTPLAREFNRIAVEEFGQRVPSAALLRTVEGTFVYVENGERFLRTAVNLDGVDAGGRFAVKDGLYEGDRIVVSGVRALWLAELHALRAGQACAHKG